MKNKINLRFRRQTLHAVHLDADIVAARQSARDLVNALLVHLHAVDGQPGPGVQLLVANVAFEVLGLLWEKSGFYKQKIFFMNFMKGSTLENFFAKMAFPWVSPPLIWKNSNSKAKSGIFGPRLQ